MSDRHPPDAVSAHWEHFDHDADIGVRGIGPTKERAFEQAALAMTAAIVDPRLLHPQECIRIVCEDADEELLFVDWLNAVVYEMATRKMLFGRFAVRLDGSRLSAEAWGEKVDAARHQPAVEVKGATLTCLRLAQEPSGEWIAQCVIDV